MWFFKKEGTKVLFLLLRNKLFVCRPQKWKFFQLPPLKDLETVRLYFITVNQQNLVYVLDLQWLAHSFPTKLTILFVSLKLHFYFISDQINYLYIFKIMFIWLTNLLTISALVIKSLETTAWGVRTHMF